MRKFVDAKICGKRHAVSTRLLTRARTPETARSSTGFREWTIRGTAVGTARITSVGYSAERGRNCDPGPCAPRLFQVAIVVR